MSRSRRAPRGNGSGMYENPDSDQIDGDEEDDFVIVDADGNPIGDDDVVVDDSVGVVDPADEEDDDPHVALKRNFEKVQAENQALTQERDTYRTQAESSKTGEVEATKAAIASAKSTAESRVAAAQRAIKEAGEAQDFKALANAQTELSNAQFDLREVSAIENQFNQESANPPQRREQPAQQTHQQKVDTWVNAQPEHAKKFANKHKAALFPEGDGKPLQKALAAWNYAVNVKGLEEGSDEFVDYVEKELGLTQKTKEPEPRRQTSAPSQRRPNAAPVKRGGSSQPTQVHLSQAELGMAKKLGMSPKKYAMNKHAALEGAKDPEYRGPRYSRDDPSIVRG